LRKNSTMTRMVHDEVYREDVALVVYAARANTAQRLVAGTRIGALDAKRLAGVSI
jgi:hypothetical protein